MLDRKILVRFATEMARAYTRLAEGLDESDEKPVQMRIVAGPKLVDILRGHRQRAVYEYLRNVGEEGRTTREVNDGIGYDFSNTYTTLHRLQGLGIVEMVPNARPQRWRLAPAYRNGKAS
jgi:hypothetical protein